MRDPSAIRTRGSGEICDGSVAVRTMSARASGSAAGSVPPAGMCGGRPPERMGGATTTSAA